MHSESASIAARRNTISSTVKAATVHYRVKRGGKGVIVTRDIVPRDIAREFQLTGLQQQARRAVLGVMRQVDGGGAVVIHGARRWITNV
jgi:hypothetical protein